MSETAAKRSVGPRLPWRHGVLAGLASGAALALLTLLGTLDGFDGRLYDTRFRLRGTRPAPDAVALVEVDDATVRGYDRWPLPRESYALLIESLFDAGAVAVGFDLTFQGRQEREPAQDELLVGVTRGHPGLVHAIGFLPRTSGYGGDLEAGSVVNPALIRHGRPISEQHVVSAAHASLPFAELLEAADAVGHTALAVDPDGVVRSLPWFVRYGDWAYPALSLRVAEIAARSDPALPQYELARDGMWMHAKGGRQRVFKDALGDTRFVFFGGEEAFAHRASMLHVLQWAAASDTAAIARVARGRLVLIGATTKSEATTDIGATPFSESASLVYVHANALAAAITGRFLWSAPPSLLAGLLLLLGALLGALYARLGLGWATSAAFAAGALFAGLDFGLFVWRDLDVPASALLLLPPLTWSAVEGLRRRATEREALVRAKELEVARAIQRRLLPGAPPATPGLDVFGLNEPADAVGGDYYDWLPLASGALVVVVADVTGHGIPAALQMAHLRACLHAEAPRGETPSAIVTAMNRMLTSATEPGRFATFFLGVVEPSGRRLNYCNAGHNPPYLVRAGSVRELGANGVPLAMLDDFPWGEGSAELEPGDTLVLYSDGVTECPRGDDMYGEERWREAVLRQAARAQSARATALALLAELDEYAQGSIEADDVTIVVVRVGT